MKKKTERELIESIVSDRTQLEVHILDECHFCGPVHKVEEKEQEITFSLLWRADYDHTTDKWYGAREIPTFSIPKKVWKIIEKDGKIIIELSDQSMVTFHPAESPLLKRNEVENLDIKVPAGTPDE